MKLMSIAGARPNFMKLAAIAYAVKSYNQQFSFDSSQIIDHIIVHTGQHYDAKMSQSFFVELDIPEPDINLDVGSGSHAIQTAEIMKRFESVLLHERPDILLVVGDVNSTIACTLVASKIEYPFEKERISSFAFSKKRPLIVHVEAGLRSFDRDMPEEVNRVLTDAISDLLFVTEDSGVNNLRREGVAEKKIKFVGNVMIDTLMQHLAKAEQSTVKQDMHIKQPYILVTLHRPSNVDRLETLEPLVDCLGQIAKQRHIVFPVHPRTEKSLKKNGLWQRMVDNPNIHLGLPLGYLDFLNLLKDADMVITDSGGIQEEATVLKVPCVTLRESTERPITLEVGTNYLIGTDPIRILETVTMILAGKGKQGQIPPLWDGKTGDRIIQELITLPG